MHRYGCIQAKVGGLELTLDPTRPLPLADGELKPAPVEEKVVSGDEKPPSRVNPLLRHKSLGLGPLLVADAGERQVAP